MTDNLSNNSPMLSNSLSDNEIIKAFAEHYKQVDKAYSDHLAYGGKGDEHEEKYIYMLRDVLDLINRQKAEIERLQKAIAVIDVMEDQHAYSLQKAKAEAYQEFWQEAKQHGMYPEDIPDEYAIPRSFFDKVYERLVGELNG